MSDSDTDTSLSSSDSEMEVKKPTMKRSGSQQTAEVIITNSGSSKASSKSKVKKMKSRPERQEKIQKKSADQIIEENTTPFQKAIIEKLMRWKEQEDAREHWTKLVLVQVYLFSIDALSTSDQSAIIDFGVQLWWQDNRLIGHVADRFDIEDTIKWWPDLHIAGSIDLQPQLPGRGSVWMHAAFSKFGIVNTYQRWKGKVNAPMHLHEFPFDQQLLTLRLHSWAWSKEHLVLEDITTESSLAEMTKTLKEIVEWKPIEIMSTRTKDVWSQGEERWISCVDTYIPVKRRPGFYLKNVIGVGLLICLMGMSVLFDSQADIAGRLTVSVTLFLATVAFAFASSDYLPKVSYSSYFSEFFTVMYMFFTLEVIENVAVYLIVKYHGDGEPDKAPFAQTLDWIAIGIIGGLQLLYFCRIIWVALIRKTRKPDFDGKRKHKPWRCKILCVSKTSLAFRDWKFGNGVCRTHTKKMKEY